MAASIVPITSLAPTSAPPADAAIRAVVTLIWPYSSSTQQCALLLADPDFRLRNKKGQVRVRFSGPSAEAIALGKLGIGDEVLLELKGSKWVENAVRTPGKSVDGELLFNMGVALQKVGGEWIRASGVTPVRSDVEQTPAARNGGRVGLLRSSLGGYGDVPIYSSPAFVKIARLSGDGFGDGYDPFTGEYEDLEDEAPRKRARVSFGAVGKWRLAGRTPSPEKEDPSVHEADGADDADVDVDMDADVTSVEPQNGAVVEENDRSTQQVVDLAHASAMAPPSLPRLHMPEEASTAASETQQGETGPSTPTLRPVPSSALPLPSPFPTEPPRADPVVETQNTAAAANVSRTTSTPLPSFGLLQSLPDTADPDDPSFQDSSPTGIYARDGEEIQGTYREHVDHPEYLSDTEEEEGLYDEHLKFMREEAMRDEYGYGDNDEQGVNEEDVEEVIEDMGEEPGESSDEEVDGMEGAEKGPTIVEIEETIDDMGEEPDESSDEEEMQTEATSKGPSVVEIEDDGLETSEPSEAAEKYPQPTTVPVIPQESNEASQAAAHQPPADEDPSSHKETQAKPAAPLKDVPPTVPLTSLKRKASPQAIPAPQTPAKLPAGIFGTDGASDTAQSTPQSERDRIMARTYSSLFGFGASPAPMQPFVQTPTPTPSAGMGRGMTTGTDAPTRSALAKSADAATESMATKDTSNESSLPPQMDAEVAIPISADVDGIQEPATANQETLDQAQQNAIPENEIPKAYMRSSSVDLSSIPSSKPLPLAEDTVMADAPEPEPSLAQVAETEQAEEAPAVAILEAAVEGDVDVTAQPSHADASVADVTEVTEDTPAPAPPPRPSQVEVIDLDDSSDDEEPAQEREVPAEEPHQLPPAEPSQSIDNMEIPNYPGSPTEIDSEEDEAVMSQAYGSLVAPSQGTVVEGGLEEETVDRVILETLQTQDVQTIQPTTETAQQASFFEEQMPVIEESQPQQPELPAVEESQMQAAQDSQPPAVEQPSTQARRPMSFNYFSFQSTSTASESFAEERPITPTAAEKGKTETKVIELMSSSPVAGLNAERQGIDVVVAEQGAEDEHMSDAEAFSPEVSVTKHVAFEVDGDDAEEVERDDAGGAEKEASAIVQDDERMSDAEAFSPEPVVAQATSLGVPMESFAASEASGPSRLHSGASADLSLPLSPEDSQPNWETQLPLTHAPQADTTTTFPPTPQLTQGDSLIKEADIVASETEEVAPAPPSRHTRSSVEPASRSSQAAPDPPSRHTRSSAEPTAVEAVDPPSRHTRSSQEPATVADSRLSHVTPDPPSRHTRSSAEPTTAVEALDPPSRHTRSSAEPTAEKQLQSPFRTASARRATRKSQTHSQISTEPIEENKLEEAEAEDTIAVLSPLQKTPVRKSARTHKPTTKEVEMRRETEENLRKKSPAKKQLTDTEEASPKKSPSKKSFTSRLSNVPDVISAWFSPRRSTRLHPDDEEPEDEPEPKQVLSVGLSTPMGYYTPLSNLNQSMNSQTRADNTVDIIAIVSDSTKAPERAKAGPKDYFTCFKMWDPSLPAETSVLVEIFRPWKATLPMAEVGDVVLLRGFSVKSRKRHPYLISTEMSSWCVWRYAEYEGADGGKGKKRAMSFSGIREEVKGPPVELGNEERERVKELRKAWDKSETSS